MALLATITSTDAVVAQHDLFAFGTFHTASFIQVNRTAKRTLASLAKFDAPGAKGLETELAVLLVAFLDKRVAHATQAFFLFVVVVVVVIFFNFGTRTGFEELKLH